MIKIIDIVEFEGIAEYEFRICIERYYSEYYVAAFFQKKLPESKCFSKNWKPLYNIPIDSLVEGYALLEQLSEELS